MIRTVQIENFKSIRELSLDLGRVTVLIGANGSGKSNILEAIAFASAAAQDKLDNEFLSSRGIRVTETQFMRSAFETSIESGSQLIIQLMNTSRYHIDDLNVKEMNTTAKTVNIHIKGDEILDYYCVLAVDESETVPKWRQLLYPKIDEMNKLLNGKNNIPDAKSLLELFQQYLSISPNNIPRFLIFAPENSALRTFQAEGQILPLGIRGEGLFAHLRALNAKHKDRLTRIKEVLTLIDWFDSFDIPEGLAYGERSIRIRDRFLPDDLLFDQRSANEGFLFLLFYITLMVSPDTPSFFAIDNIDTSLNPKLCVALIQQIVKLSAEFDKQVIITTHNPAVLDGLNLKDDEQRLLVVSRNHSGYTRVHRVDPPKPKEGEYPVSLSDAFMRGYIGGLPKNF